jgi:WD40 repeat protein
MKRANEEDDVRQAKRLAKHVRQDHQRKLRLVRTGRLLETHISIPDVRDLILRYANEFDGVSIMSRNQKPSSEAWIQSTLTVWMDCLVSTSHHNVIVWDLDARIPKLELVGHTAHIFALAVLTNGQLASGSADNTVRVWNLDGECVATLVGHTERVLALAALDNGHLASRSRDWSVRVWDPTSRSCIFQVAYPMGCEFFAALPHGTLACVTFGGANLDVFEVGSKAKLHSLEAGGIQCLTTLPDGRLASGSFKGQVRVWNGAQGTFCSANGHVRNVTAIAAFGQWLATGSMDQICVWLTDGLVCLFKIAGYSNRISALAFLPDGKLVSSAADETIRGWDTSTGQCALTIKVKVEIIHLAVLPDCKLAGVSYGGYVGASVHVWG